MIRKWIAAMLSLAMVITGAAVIPVNGTAAVKAPGTPVIAKPTGSASSDGSSKSIRFSWSAVSGAKGYQYQYDLSWGTKNSKVVKGFVKKTAKKISFKSHGNVRFQIRAYKTTKKNGKTKKVYGQWASKTVTSGQVDDLFNDGGSSGGGGSTGGGTAGAGTTWTSVTDSRATLIVGDERDGASLITIIWRGNATSEKRWVFYGRNIGTSGNIELSGGIEYKYEYDIYGNILSGSEEKHGLTGLMTYNSSKATYTWNGSAEYTGIDADLVFSKW